MGNYSKMSKNSLSSGDIFLSIPEQNGTKNTITMHWKYKKNHDDSLTNDYT